MNPDVLVVGGGPAGAATAYWLARDGLSVVVAEKKSYPRDKTCGDGLTPRAVKQLTDMGFDFDVPELHKIIGLRAYAGDLTLELPWPENTFDAICTSPTYGNRMADHHDARGGELGLQVDLDRRVAPFVSWSTTRSCSRITRCTFIFSEVPILSWAPTRPRRNATLYSRPFKGHGDRLRNSHPMMKCTPASG